MIKKEKNGLTWYTWELAEKYGITAGTTCRSNRAGRPFNLALHTPGESDTVLGNRKYLMEALEREADAFTAGEQIHGIGSRIVLEKDRGRGAFEQKECFPGTDALITRESSLVPVIFTADCLPVVLYDTQKKAAAVIHAGWRGCAGGIVPATLSRMIHELDCKTENILGLCGPAIGACCYQIDTPVFRGITESWPETEKAFEPDGTDHWRFSLEDAVEGQLIQAGVKAEHVEKAGLCTCCHPDFFSWRGDGPETGRMGTFARLP